MVEPRFCDGKPLPSDTSMVAESTRGEKAGPEKILHEKTARADQVSLARQYDSLVKSSITTARAVLTANQKKAAW